MSKLAARDTAVRAHEAAHQAAAGGLGGAASFSYETGPDGKRYAVGGEVPVSLRPGRTPQETIANAQTVRSAALAPADPSAQDLAVAAQASQMEAQARQEIAQNRRRAAAEATAARRSRPRAAQQRGSDGSVGAAAGRSGDRGWTEATTSPGAVPATPQAASGPAQPNPAGSGGRRRARSACMVFSTLKSERSSTSGAFYGHLHSSGDGCAICARAAARYA